jgi:hypothetical protein
MRRKRTPAPDPVADAVEIAKAEGRAGRSFLRRHARRLALLFIGVLLPMWAFAELADEVRDAEAFPFDEPLLRLAQSMAQDGFDRWFLFFSRIGYAYGVVPVAVALVVVLALLRRFRESIFAAAALGGSALLNIAAKQSYDRSCGRRSHPSRPTAFPAATPWDR